MASMKRQFVCIYYRSSLTARTEKMREKKLAQADQELYSAQLSPLKETNSFQKMAVMKVFQV